MDFVIVAMVELALVILLDRVSTIKLARNNASSKSDNETLEGRKRNALLKVRLSFCSKNIVDKIDFIVFWVYMAAFLLFIMVYNLQYKQA